MRTKPTYNNFLNTTSNLLEHALKYIDHKNDKIDKIAIIDKIITRQETLILTLLNFIKIRDTILPSTPENLKGGQPTKKSGFMQRFLSSLSKKQKEPTKPTEPIESTEAITIDDIYKIIATILNFKEIFNNTIKNKVINDNDIRRDKKINTQFIKFIKNTEIINNEIKILYDSLTNTQRLEVDKYRHMHNSPIDNRKQILYEAYGFNPITAAKEAIAAAAIAEAKAAASLATENIFQN
jgi:hypothetical protein